MIHTKEKSKRGVTLTEMILACAVAAIIAMLVGIVLVAGQRNWLASFNRANTGIEVDAYLTTITFGNTGRQANKRDYCIYKVDTGGTYLPASPQPSNPVAVVDGNAIEFRYWNVPFDASLIDVTKTATEYRLFYLEGDNLMMDQGPYPPGGVNATGGRITGAGVTTQQLASHVSALRFSHTAKAVVDLTKVPYSTPGDGGIRMAIVFTDPTNNRTITVKTATLMRNVWP